MIKRIRHNPFVVDHKGINASCTEHGVVTLTSADGKSLTVPAGLILKLSTMIKFTRIMEDVDESGKVVKE